MCAVCVVCRICRIVPYLFFCAVCVVCRICRICRFVLYLANHPEDAPGDDDSAPDAVFYSNVHAACSAPLQPLGEYAV